MEGGASTTVACPRGDEDQPRQRTESIPRMRSRCWCSGGLFLGLQLVRPSSLLFRRATRRARFHVRAAASLPCCLSLAFLLGLQLVLPACFPSTDCASGVVTLSCTSMCLRSHHRRRLRHGRRMDDDQARPMLLDGRRSARRGTEVWRDEWSVQVFDPVMRPCGMLPHMKEETTLNQSVSLDVG